MARHPCRAILIWGDKMAKDLATYEGYLEQMVQYRKQQEANKKNVAKFEEYAQKIQVLRHAMIMENVDVYSIERDTYKALYNKEPYDAWLDQANVHIQEAYLTKAMVDIRNRWDTATQIEKAGIKNEAHQLRMKIIAMGIEPYQFEDRAWLLYRGKALTAAEKTTQYPLVATAIQDVAKLNAAKKKDLANAPVASWEQKRPNVSKMELENRYSETYSGADMVIFMAFPGYKPLEIGVASVVSYSIYREKKQIRTVGRVSSKGITKGPRTISGRLIFTVIREHIVEMIRKEIPYLRDIKTLLMDELPAFDILVSFGNEYGGSAGLVIQGITVVDEQKTLSIEDLFTENIFTYIARGLEPMRSLTFKNGEPYEPLKWFTSSFRAAGSEVLGNFKPKETQLFHDAQILTTPTPFYGNKSGWDSSKYNLEIGIPIGEYLGNSGTGSDTGRSMDDPIYDKTQNPGVEDNKIFVQAVIPTPSGIWQPVGGTVKLYVNNKEVASKKTATHKGDSILPLVWSYQAKKGKVQEFPIAYENTTLAGALFTKIAFKKGDVIKATYTDASSGIKTASASETVRIADQIPIIIKTTMVGYEIALDTPTKFVYQSSSGGVKATTYYSNEKPSSQNYTYSWLTTMGKKTEELPDKVTLKISDEAQPLPYWPARWIWTLDLSKCDRRDVPNGIEDKEVTKLKAINETNGMNSMAAHAAWNAQAGTSVTGWKDTISISDGTMAFYPADWFFTVSDKGSNGKRKKIKWEALPRDAILTFSCTCFKTKDSKKTAADNHLTVKIVFVKD